MYPGAARYTFVTDHDEMTKRIDGQVKEEIKKKKEKEKKAKEEGRKKEKR